MILAIVSLDSLDSLCKVISIDFLIKPVSKVLYKFGDNLFFFSSFILRLPTPLQFVFSKNIKEPKKFLVCDSRPFLSDKLPEKLSFYVPIIRFTIEFPFNMLDTSPDLIQQWGVVIENLKSDSIINKRSLVIIESSRQYALILHPRKQIYILPIESIENLLDDIFYKVYALDLKFASSKF